MAAQPVAPLDLIAADTLLSEEEREIRTTVRRYLDAEVRPHLADWFESGELPARELAERPRRPRGPRHAPRGLRLRGHQRGRIRARLHRARGRGLGHPVPGVGPGLARDVRHPRLRQRGAEAGVAPPDGCGRGRRLLRADRARLRVQSVGHAYAGQAGGLRLGAHRHQDVDHQRGHRRRRHRLGADRRRDPRVRRPDRRPRLHGQPRAQEAVAARVGDQRAGARRRTAAGAPPSSPGRRGSAVRSAASTRPASASCSAPSVRRATASRLRSTTR